MERKEGEKKKKGTKELIWMLNTRNLRESEMCGFEF